MNSSVAKLLRDIVKASKHDDDSPGADWEAWGSTTGGMIRISWFVDDFPKCEAFTERLKRNGFELEGSAPHHRSWVRFGL